MSAIIGVLVGLFLPAVQAAREAARRTICSNRMKQLVLGIHTHVDTYQVLPAGSWDVPAGAQCDQTSWNTINNFSATSGHRTPSSCFAKWQEAKFVEDSTVSLLGAYRSPGMHWSSGSHNYWSFCTALAPNGPTCTQGDNTTSGGIITPRSYHRGGVNAAMLDGAAVFISQNIDVGNNALSERKKLSDGPTRYGVWGRLGCRGDGESVSRSDYE